MSIDSISVLIGSNNSGKSSILQGLHFGASTALSAKLFSDAVWRGDSFECVLPSDQLLYLPSDSASSLVALGAKESVIALNSSVGKCTVTVAPEGDRHVSVVIQGQALGQQLQDPDSPFSVYAPGLAGITAREVYISTGLLRRRVAQGDANVTLRNVLQRLERDRTKWGRFRDELASVFPATDLRVRYDENASEFVAIDFKPDGAEWLPLEVAGNGFLQACQLIAYVELYEPRMLLLDEPDSHLHPDNQRRLCRLLVELLQTREFQIVLGTHSRHVFDSLRDRSTPIWVLHGKSAELPADKLASMLLDLGAFDSVEYLANGALRCVIATEDDDTSNLEVLLEASGFKMSECYVLSYSGSSQLNSARVLRSLLAEVAPKVALVVHRDQDYMPDDERQEMEGEMVAEGIYPFITDGSDIEHVFLNAEHLSAVTGVDLAQVVKLLEATVAALDEASLERMMNLRHAAAERARKRTKKQPNVGAISSEVTKLYRGNPTQHCHGKTVLGPMKAALQKETGKNVDVAVTSEHIRVTRLAAIAAELWPLKVPTT